jgi:hypothetical protein
MRYKKLFIGIATCTAALAVGAGVAFAVWSASGSGSGTGAGATAVALTVNPSTPTGANSNIYPGGPPGTVQFTITNPNPYAVSLTGLSWNGVTSTNTSSCASGNLSIDGSAPTSMPAVIVAAGATSPLIDVNGVIDMVSTAPPGCQAVAFEAGLTVTGTQVP